MHECLTICKEVFTHTRFFTNNSNVIKDVGSVRCNLIFHLLSGYYAYEDIFAINTVSNGNNATSLTLYNNNEHTQ